MVTMPQIGLPEERGLLARIGEANETNLGLVAEVVAPGRMRVGDEVVVGPRGHAHSGACPHDEPALPTKCSSWVRRVRTASLHTVVNPHPQPPAPPPTAVISPDATA